MSILHLQGISKLFGPTVALAGVGLELEPGRVHAVIGENGAGKSTLMNILAGALRPDDGRMELDGAPYAPDSPLEARHRGIALIHQELSLCPHLSVWENILMGVETARLGWLDQKECRRRAQAVLENFTHPDVRPDRIVRDLSIAARQVVEICRALAFEARIILMDEPTSSLPRDDVRHLFRLIRSLREGGISVVYISHFLEEVREIADEFTVLRDGASVASGPLDAVSDDELIAAMVGRPVETLYPPRAGCALGEVLLEVRGISAPPALQDATFQLHRGEVLGIAGLMGSGRTALIRALFGLIKPESGSVRVGSELGEAGSATPLTRIRQGIGYLSEDRKEEGLAVSLSVADNISMTRLSACSRWGWLNLKQQGQLARDWIQRLSIRAGHPFQVTRTLSGGNQQKVALARLLHQEADIFLLDEPTRGIDIGSKVQIYEAITRLADANKGVLIVSSYLPELFGICDRLGVMSRGRLGPVRPAGEWTPESVLQAAIGTGARETLSSTGVI